MPPGSSQSVNNAFHNAYEETEAGGAGMLLGQQSAPSLLLLPSPSPPTTPTTPTTTTTPDAEAERPQRPRAFPRRFRASAPAASRVSELLHCLLS